MPSAIETHPRKQEIIDSIIAGVSLRKVGKMAGLSHTVIDAYKKKVVIPSMERAAKIAKLEQLTQNLEDKALEPGRIAELTKQVASVSDSSIWFERHQKLWEISLEGIEKARHAVKVIKTPEGERYGGQDFGPLGAMLAAAHKNQELSGKAWRVLSDDTANSINIDSLMVVMPRAETESVPRETSHVTLEVKPVTDGKP